MKYACLLYGDESDPVASPEPGSDAFDSMMAGYMAFGEEFGSKIHAGEPLEAVATATCLRVRNGDKMTTDGPYAETKEQLGGFYVIEADDLDEAIAMASKIPAATTGTVEIRPVPDFG